MSLLARPKSLEPQQEILSTSRISGWNQGIQISIDQNLVPSDQSSAEAKLSPARPDRSPLGFDQRRASLDRNRTSSNLSPVLSDPSGDHSDLSPETASRRAELTPTSSENPNKYTQTGIFTVYLLPSTGCSSSARGFIRLKALSALCVLLLALCALPFASRATGLNSSAYRLLTSAYTSVFGSRSVAPMATCTSNGTGGGNWNTGTTWSGCTGGGGIPAAADDVTIKNGDTVTIDTTAAAVCNSLTVGEGTSGILQFNSTAAQTITVTTNVTIASGGTFQSATTGTVTTHSLSLGGNLTNNGTLDFSTNANTAGAGITFTGAANNTFGGTGATTDIRALTINKGTSNANILELNPSNFTVQGTTTDGTPMAFLTLTNGTFKISGSFTVTGRVFSSGYSIGATQGFWLNNSNFTIAGQGASVTNSGLLRVSAGTFNVGTSGGNALSLPGGSSLDIQGGAVSTAGRTQATGGNVSIATGTLTVCKVGCASANGSFDLSATSTLTMSSGTVALQNASTNGTPIDVLITSGSGAKTISGGTIQIGNASTPASQTFRISSGIALQNLTINDVNNPTAKLNAAMTLNGTVTLSGGSFDNSTSNITFGSGATISRDTGTISATPNFGSTVNVIYTGSTAVTSGNEIPSSAGILSNLTINKSGGITLGSAATVNNTLTLTTGTFTIGSNLTMALATTISRAAGSLSGTPTFGSQISLNYTGSTSVTTGTEVPTGTVKLFTVNNTGGVTLGSNLSSNNTNTVGSGASLSTGVFTYTESGGLTNSGTINVSSGGKMVQGSPFANSGTTNVAGTFQLNDGAQVPTGNALVYSSGSTLLFNNASSYSLEANGWPATNGPTNVTVNSGTSGITLNAARTVNGTFQYAAGVNGAANLTLNGTSQVNNGGFLSAFPTYGSSSLLKYNVNGSYGRNSEWKPNVTGGAGYPANVQLSNNTNLDLANGSTGTFTLGGNLTVDSGSTMKLNGAITVADLGVKGNFANSGSYSAGSQTLTFSGGAAQTWSDSNSQNFGAVVINNSSTGVTLNSNVGCATVTDTAGALNLNGFTLTNSGTLSVSNTLKGTGTISGAVSVANGGAIAPGNSPGIINSGNVTFTSGSNFNVEIGGTTVGTQYDQLNVTGTVALGNATLNLTQINSYPPGVNDSFTIINNDSNDAIGGTFNGLTEGAVISNNFFGSGFLAKISYVGGDGNDVVITVVSANTISGTVFNASGIPITDGRTIKLIQNGTVSGTTATSNASGIYSFTGLNLLNGNQIIVYVAGDVTTKGATFTLTGTSDITTLDIFQNELVVRSDNGSVVTNADLKSAQGVSPDADLQGVHNVNPSNILTTQPGHGLRIWSGTSYAPGADINDGGNWINNGTFTGGTHTVAFNGSSNQTIKGNNATTFNNLLIDSAGTSPNNVVTLDVTSGAVNTTVAALDISHGVFDLGLGASSTFICNGSGDVVTVRPGATWKWYGFGTLTLWGNVNNSGTINFNSHGSACGENDDILIRSSASGTQRTWKGSGTFSFADVNVQDQKVPDPTLPIPTLPVQIIVNSGSQPLVAPNNSGWTFTNTCVGPYTWIGGANQDWSVPTNWSPGRLNISTTDVLIFNGNVTPSPIVTNVPSETDAALRLTNGAFVTFGPNTFASTLILNGNSGQDLDIPSGTQLTLSGSGGLIIELTGAGHECTVAGGLIFQGSSHRLTGQSGLPLPPAITFVGPNGFFTAATGFSGNPFGSGTDGSVVFQSGSTGNFNDGGNPFGGVLNSVTVFDLGSNAIFRKNSAFASGRSYGNLTLTGNENFNASGGNVTTVLNNFLLGSGSNFALSLTPGGDLTIDGNFGDQNTLGDHFDAKGRTVTFAGGGTQQTITKAGGPALTFHGVLIDETAGGKVTLNSPVSITGQLNLSTNAAVLELNGQTLELGGTVTGAGNLKGSVSSNLLISGAGSIGPLNFLTGFQTLSTLNMNRGLPSGSATLGNDLLVSNLFLTDGIVNTGAFTLTITGSVTRGSGYIVGNEQRNFNCNDPCTVTFNVGTASSYSPVEEVIHVLGGSSTVYTQTIKAVEGKHPAIPGANALQRYWTLSEPNGATPTNGVDITFHYKDGIFPGGDIVGTEANYKIFRNDGGSFNLVPNQSIDTGGNTATATGVITFSDWTLAELAAVTPGSLGFVGAPYSDSETDTNHDVVITVRRSGGSAGAVSVNYNVTNGTATTADNDYSASPASGTLSWTDGETADKTITINVKGDLRPEPAETVNVGLSNPTGGATIGAPNSTTLTITNDDVPPAALLVNTTNDLDDGLCDVTHCSLREAINAANINADTNTITFNIPIATDPGCNSGAGPCTISLGNSLSSIDNPVNINGPNLNGPGANGLTVQRSVLGGTPAFRILTIGNSVTATINDLTISNGLLSDPVQDLGAGIFNGGNLTLNGVTVSGNQVTGSGNDYGGGIYNGPGDALVMINCTVSGNSAAAFGDDQGGGIYNAGNLTLTGVTVSGNTIGGSGNDWGAGIFNGDTLLMIGCAVSGNTAGGSSIDEGGGILNAGTATIINTTVAGNTASGSSPDYGGGINNRTDSTLNLINCTVSGNSVKDGANDQGGGVFNLGTATLRNTIVAGNTASLAKPDLAGILTSLGHNIIGDTSGATITQQTGDLFDANATPLNLGALANNGGPTQTMKLNTGSVAIDAGDDCVADVAHCSDANLPQLTTDQRGAGFPRKQDGNSDSTVTVDIGAYEAPACTTPPPTPTPTNTGPYVEGQTIQLSTAVVAGATYVWTGPTSFTSSLPNPTRANATTGDAGTYSVTVTVNGCISAAGTTNVVVNANDTDVTLSGGNLVISDANGGNTDDTLTISRNGLNVRINDPTHTLSCSGGTPIGTHICEISYSSIIGSIQVNTAAGNDALTLKLDDGNFFPAGGLTYNGGNPTTTPGDKLSITGGSQGTVTYHYTNAHDGTINMTGVAGGMVTYTGLEPITNSGTASDIVFNLPGGGTNATLSNDGASGTPLRLSGTTFETTDFANPTGSLKVNRGDSSDTLTVNALPDFNASLAIGSVGNEFSTIAFDGAVTLASSKNLSGNASSTISISSNSSISVVNGALTLAANTQPTATAGSFIGVDIQGSVTASGTGVVTIKGRGGNTGINQYGVWVHTLNGIVKGGTTAGTTTVDIDGTGGPGDGGCNGVYVQSAIVSSFGGNVAVKGTGGSAGSGGVNHGVYVTGTITSGGNGNVTVEGSGGTGGNQNLGVFVLQGGAITSAGTGTIAVNGTGGNGTTSHGVEISSGSLIKSGGAGTVSVTGTGGGASGNGVYLTELSLESRIGSGGGTISVTGTPGGSGIGIEANAGTSPPGSSSISSDGNGAVTLTSDTMRFSAGAFISAGTGQVKLGQKTNGRLINLGSLVDSTANTLELSDAELDRVTAGTLNIGDNNSGAITFSGASPIDVTNGPTIATVNLVTGSAINSNSTAGVLDIVAAALNLTSVTGIDIEMDAVTLTTTSANLQNLREANTVAVGASGINASGFTLTLSGGRFNTVSGGGDILANSVQVLSGATIGGTGAVTTGGATNVQSGGTVSPGTSPGILNTGNVTFNSGSTYAVEINGPTAGTGHDQLKATGTVSLGGATLNLTGTHTPAAGDIFIIIDNDDTDAVTPNFAMGTGGTDANGGLLEEGETITHFLGSPLSATITYAGDTDGNDVVLTVLASATEIDVQGGSPLVSIPAGDTSPEAADDTDFGPVTIGNSSSHTFTILNTGPTPLNLTGTPKVQVSGSSDFTVTTQPGSPVAASDSTTFVVQFTPSGPGAVTATISIANDDTDENPYTFNVTGLNPCHTLTVTETGDDPDLAPGDGVCQTVTSGCSLRAAIMESNNLTSCSPLTIDFSLPGSEPQTITLESALPTITHSVTIQGTVGQMIMVDGAFRFRIFKVDPVFEPNITVKISDLTIFDASDANPGAGLSNEGGTVNVSNCVFTGNQTDDANGAAIANMSGTLNVWNSTFSMNQTFNAASGGAIYVHDGTVTLTNDTISENSAEDDAGGVFQDGGTLNVRNTIIAGNSSSANSDVKGTFTSLGHNIIGAGDGAPGFVDGTNGDHVGTEEAPFDAGLGLFGDYGGATQTYALLPISPAIEGGDNCVLTGCSSTIQAINTDQRSVPRPQGTRVDIGAYEMDSYVVNTTEDHVPGLCESLVLGDPTKDCTLREAIMASNQNTTNFSQIAFGIPNTDTGCDSGGICTIALAATPGGQGALPPITYPVLINGYTQTGAKANDQNLSVGDNAELKIVLSGFTSTGLIGLDFCPGSENSTVRGLVINNFQGSGIRLKNGAGFFNAGLNLVAGNFIGTDATGMNAVPNGSGVAVVNGTLNLIGGEKPADRNLISGNTGDGVRISGYNTGLNSVEGNYIGTKKDGDSALPNDVGVYMLKFSGGNLIGCETENGDNVISGNTTAGIRINESDENTIKGNLIGTDKTGVHAIANGLGVDICDASGNAVGYYGYGSLISGNTGPGVRIKTTSSASAPSSGNLVYSNKIGTNAAGNNRIPNDVGILIQNSQMNDIGDGQPANRNVVSGNTQAGIRLENAIGTTVFGNFIGTDKNGVAKMPNATGTGVVLSGGSANDIGCLVTGSTNVISGNAGNGVELTDSASANFVQSNFIGLQVDGVSALANTGIGVAVDLGANGNVIGVEPSGGFDRTRLDGAQAKTRSAAAAQPGSVPGGGCSRRATSNNQNTQGFKAAQQLKAKAQFALGSSPGQSRTALAGRAMKATRDTATSAKAKASRSAPAKSLPGANAQGVAGKSSPLAPPPPAPLTGVNMIANNGKDGVRVSGNSVNNIISQNSIFANGALGINLGPDGDGVTENNTAGHSGPNNYQNFPKLNFANPNDLKINFDMDGTGGSEPFTIEFFVNGSFVNGACDGTNGEGKTWIGSASVSSGNNQNYVVLSPFSFANGEVITATATDSYGNTSEFSNCIVAGPPAISIGNSVTLSEGNSSTTDFTFNVTLSHPYSEAVTVQYATQDGTTNPATGGATCGGITDYETKSGTLTFNPGETTVPVTISVCGDGFIESDETFFVNLSSAGGATIANAQGTGTINNDDCPGDLLVNYDGDSHDVFRGDGNCADSFQRCSLRAAVEEANAYVNCPVTININFAFSTDTTIVVSPPKGGELFIQHNVNINGPDPVTDQYHLSIDGNGQNRAFVIDGDNTVSISNLTIDDCLAPTGLSATDGYGGAILNLGTLTLKGVLVGSSDQFLRNRALNGGGIANLTTNSLTLINTTISGNQATGNGGGIYSAGDISATNVTIAYNTANSDNTGTESGGGISVASGDVRLHNTIVADNLKGLSSGTTADDISGVVNAASSYNVIGAGSGGLTNGGANNNQVGVASALLKPLQINGGPTQTHALTYRSPAVDAGDSCVVNNSCLPALGFDLKTDQRNKPRTPLNDGDDNGTTGVDIGAYERQVTETRDVQFGTGASVDIVDVIITFTCVLPCEERTNREVAVKRDTRIAPAAGTPTASLTSIDPAPLNSLTRPPNLVIGSSSSPPLPAFEVTTTAQYTPPATLCFYLPSFTDPIFFAGLKVLHREAGPNLNYGDSDDVMAAAQNPTTNFANKLVCGDVQSFSAFAIAHTVTPTAANGSVSGQILDNNGAPVEGAAVRMSGAQNRLTITNAEGNYHFDNVETNGFYVVTPSRANFSFSPTQRSFSQLGAHTDAVFTGTAAGSALNPLDATEYFVRQQYLDFLGREPDESGFNFWVNNIESCGNDSACREVKRIDTSAAFFLSIEFQQTGYLVYRAYEAAYGDLDGAPVPVTLREFNPDTRKIGNGVVVLQSGWQQKLETNKQTFINEFVQRPRFTAAYPTSMTPAQFVDKLFKTALVESTDPDYAASIALFAGAIDTADVAARTQALRRLAENSSLTRRQFNRAFVLMEYFGYLRRDPNSGRDPDFNGYSFWLDKLDAFHGSFQNAEMVKAFLSSTEYRGRFPR
jgi:CSLREA domain-containing protein